MNRPLDRERIPEYKLTISVKDNPENPRIARRVRLEGTAWGWGKQGRVLKTHRRPGRRVGCTGLGVSKCWVQIPVLPVSGCVTLASQFLSASILFFFCKLKTTPTPRLQRGLEGANICKVLSTVPGTWPTLRELSPSALKPLAFGCTPQLCVHVTHMPKGLHFPLEDDFSLKSQRNCFSLPRRGRYCKQTVPFGGGLQPSQPMRSGAGSLGLACVSDASD